MRGALSGALALTLGLACATAGRRTATCRPADVGEIRLEGIALWRDDARAAYSIIHDGACGWQYVGLRDLALPALARRGLHVGLSAIVKDCQEGNDEWRRLAAAAAQGHEIVSHSMTHTPITLENAAREVVGPKAIFARHLDQPVTFYAFPYDQFTKATLEAVAAAGYLGARGGRRDDNDGADNPPINTAEPAGDFEVEFDIWPRSQSLYSLFCDADLLNVHVWNAIERRGWAVRELHSVMRDGDAPEAHGFGVTPLSVYEAHLDFVAAASRANKLWVDTPTTVLKYRHARKACRAAVEQERIRFDGSDAECVRFATPISVVVRTREDLPGLAALQGGRTVPVRRLAPGRWSVTADPTGGDVALSGCTDAGPAVDTTVALGPRPTPASSVCELAQIKGAGGWWPLDDFERVEDQFRAQELPSWVSYPDKIKPMRVREGDGAVLRYAGKGLAAWSGITYLFTGRDGLGVCYDVGLHQGLRFRIRGSVESSDAFTGKVILSLLTAETRSRVYGGDLAGEGGHFHIALPVTADWQSVEIPWSRLAAPTWGATASATQPALAKVQGFDWSITDAASSFEIDLDDIELY